MIKIYSYLFLILNLISFASHGEVWYWNVNQQTQQQINTEEKDGVSYDKDCLKRKNCLALKSIVGLQKINLTESKQAENTFFSISPLSTLCHQLKAAEQILTAVDGHQEFFCLFSDNSWINTGKLFLKYNSVKTN
jgi:hypothetical protein